MVSCSISIFAGMFPPLRGLNLSNEIIEDFGIKHTIFPRQIASSHALKCPAPPRRNYDHFFGLVVYPPEKYWKKMMK